MNINLLTQQELTEFSMRWSIKNGNTRLKFRSDREHLCVVFLEDTTGSE